MLLEDAIKIHKESGNKIDMLETLWIEIKNNHLEEEYYKKKIEKMPKWDYFISDLDGTFYRGMLLKEAFTLFIKYVKDYDIRKMDMDLYKEFLDDYINFVEIERDACNKKVDYYDYTDAGLFMIYKYQKLIDFDNFLEVLKASFHRKDKVNPFRFSMKILKETILKWNNFLFISWASNFVFLIYLDLLKKDITEELWEKYAEKIYGISTYADFEDQNVFDSWSAFWKNKLINDLKDTWVIKKVIWWMWDTTSDFWISDNLEKCSDFYFINPAKSVVTKFDELKKPWVNFHFITEKKDLIFEFEIEKIKLV